MLFQFLFNIWMGFIGNLLLNVMRVLVVKFGGTSVRYGHNNIVQIIKKYKKSGIKL